MARKVLTKIQKLLSRHRIPAAIVFILGPFLLFLQDPEYWKILLAEIFPSSDLPPFFKHQQYFNYTYSWPTFAKIPDSCNIFPNGLLIIMSIPRANSEYRELYRNVYKNIANIQIRFLMGTATDQEESKISNNISEEMSINNDLIIGNAADDINLKLLFGYTYVKGIYRKSGGLFFNAKFLNFLTKFFNASFFTRNFLAPNFFYTQFFLII